LDVRVDIPTVKALQEPDIWEILAALPPYDPHLAMAQGEELRKAGIPAATAAAMMTQSRLRARAQAKFGDFAEGMLFTQDGLEQATRLLVAALHARRFLAAGCQHVADLTCGIGADSLALAGVGLTVTAHEIDPVTAELARWNLRHFPSATVVQQDGLTCDFGALGVDGIFADPARRITSSVARARRIMDPAHYEPALDAVWNLRNRVPNLGIKVGPGIPHDGLPQDAEVQWVSVNGDVVEAGLWFGSLAQHGPGRCVLVVTTGENGTVARELRAAPEDEAAPTDSPNGDAAGGRAPTGPVGQYLWEPDGAVIRAGLVTTAARELGGHLIDPTIAYITSTTLPTLTNPPIATGYRVLDVMPFAVKRLRSYLRERHVGRVTIKKRGTAVTPENLRKQLALQGNAEATVVLTRVAGKQSMVIVEPL
jgi:hypothetical protein